MAPNSFHDYARVVGDAAEPAVLTWETASDWDNAISESGVVHESVANTDLNDASVIQQGYSAANPFKQANQIFYYPLDEDSGSTAYDFSGNNNDATDNGATVNQDGINGTSEYYFDGTDDYLLTPSVTSSTFSIVAWVSPDTPKDGNVEQLITSDGGGSTRHFQFRIDGDGVVRFIWFDSSGTDIQVTTGTDDLDDGFTYMVSARHDGSTGYVNINGTAVENTASGDITQRTQEVGIGADNNGNNHYTGGMDNVYMFDSYITDSELNQLYNVAANDGLLTTATKSLSTAAKPDLTNLDYNNDNTSGSPAKIDVIGSPGTTDEEIVSQTLDGSTSYTLTWSNSHTDFRIKPILTANNRKDTDTIRSVTLQG